MTPSSAAARGLGQQRNLLALLTVLKCLFDLPPMLLLLLLLLLLLRLLLLRLLLQLLAWHMLLLLLVAVLLQTRLPSVRSL